jgi:ABC-2 type transport system permease protein
MSKLLKLSIVQFKNTFNIFDGKQKVKPIHIVFAILIFLSILPSFFSIAFIVYEGILLLMPLQQEAIILSLWIVALSSLIFFLALFIIPALFYFNKDIERLLVLPIEAKWLLGSKLILVYGYEGLTVLFLSLPILIPYIILVQPSLTFYPIVLVLMLTISLVPLALAGLLTMVIMSLFPLFKNRDLFNLLSSFIILAVAIAFSFMVNQPVGMDAEALALALVEGNNSLSQFIQGFIPSTQFAIDALVYYSLIDLLIYLAIVALSLVLFMGLGQKLYFKGVLGVSETASRRHQLSEQTYTKVTQKTPVLFAYWLKEMRLLIRTPIYLFNNVSTSILMPILILPIFLTQANSDDQFIQWIQSIDWTSPNVLMIVLLIGLGIGAMMSALNLITPTALSREGTAIGFMKYIPLSYTYQIYAKILSGLVISLFGLSVFIGSMAFVLQWTWWVIGLAFVSALFGCVLLNVLGMLIDLIRPKLIWENEAVPVKQNLNAFFSLGMAFVIVAGFYFLTQLFTPSFFSASLFLLSLVALNIAAWYLLKHSINPLMNQIEL